MRNDGSGGCGRRSARHSGTCAYTRTVRARDVHAGMCVCVRCVRVHVHVRVRVRAMCSMCAVCVRATIEVVEGAQARIAVLMRSEHVLDTIFYMRPRLILGCGCHFPSVSHTFAVACSWSCGTTRNALVVNAHHRSVARDCSSPLHGRRFDREAGLKSDLDMRRQSSRRTVSSCSLP